MKSINDFINDLLMDKSMKKKSKTFRQFLKSINAMDFVFNNPRADRMFPQIGKMSQDQLDKEMLYDTKEKREHDAPSHNT